jgi:hypothetical protein
VAVRNAVDGVAAHHRVDVLGAIGVGVEREFLEQLAQGGPDRVHGVVVADMGRKDTFMVSRISRYGARIIHQGLPKSESGRQRTMPLHELEAMHDAGLIELEIDSPQNRGRFRFTPEGEAHAHFLRRRGEGGTGGLEWHTDALPVLRATHVANRDADEMGVYQDAINEVLGRQPNDPRTDRVLFELEQGGFITGTISAHSGSGPTTCRLTGKGLQQVAGWPTGASDDLVLRLLTVLEERIRETTDPNERSRLQRLRDGIIDVGENVVAQVLAKVLTGQVNGML